MRKNVTEVGKGSPEDFPEGQRNNRLSSLSGDARLKRWDFMTGLAILVDAHVQGGCGERSFGSNLDAVTFFLRSILEKFPEPEDSKADPEGFAVWHMTSTLLRALTAREFQAQGPGNPPIAQGAHLVDRN